jgi:hypothetical protein
MDIDMVLRSLPETELQATSYFAAFNKSFEANWGRSYETEDISGAGAIASVSVSRLREKLETKLNELLDFYLSCSADDREKLRNSIAKLRQMLAALHAYIGWCEEQLNCPQDRLFLRRALAACSLGDNRMSYKETYLALGSLYLASIRAGIHPSTEFAGVAGLSSSTEGVNGETMKSFLGNFEDSAFFDADVKPKLNQ